MNILTPNRARMPRIVSNSFDKVLGLIGGVWSVEHNDDGTHGDVTAESLTVSGPTQLDDLDVQGFVEPLNFGDDDNGDIGLGRATIVGETDYSNFPTGAVTADVVRPVLASERSFVPENDDDESLGYLSDVGANSRRWRNGYFSKHVNANTVYGSSGLYERTYSVALGEWTTFTPTLTAGTGTWTTTVGDVVTACYAVIGKKLTVLLVLDTTTNSAITASVSCAIPGGYTAAKTVYGVSFISDSGVEANGIAAVVAAGTTMIFFKHNGATIAANTNTLYVRCVFTFEIQ